METAVLDPVLPRLSGGEDGQLEELGGQLDASREETWPSWRRRGGGRKSGRRREEEE